MTEQDKVVRDGRDAGAYREMESDLRDLVNMGRIAADLAHDADGEPSVCEKRTSPCLASTISGRCCSDLR